MQNFDTGLQVFNAKSPCSSRPILEQPLQFSHGKTMIYMKTIISIILKAPFTKKYKITLNILVGTNFQLLSSQRVA